jgi:mono/diheme cytochrome c family protein
MKRIALLSAATALLVLGCSSGDEKAASGSDADSVPESSTPVPGTEPGGEKAEIAFKDVQDILTAKCSGCHGVSDPKEEFSVVSYESIMKGSEHGPVIVAGDAANSKMVHALRGEGMDRMPFKMDALPEEDIAKIEAWINAGAKNE